MSTSQGAADLTMIVVAAGDSRRFGSNKLFATLSGRPVLAWSLDACERSPLVRSMVLVVSDSSRPAVERLVARRGYRKIRAICLGGRRRQDSVWNGLLAVEGVELVGVHDAARPFLDDDVISRVVEATLRTGAAVAAVPVKDTVKVVGATGVVEQTPPRSGLWAAQTPQIFRYSSLVAAFRENDNHSVTDDAELVERAGWPVEVAHGTYDNIKITTPEDLLLARAIARRISPHPLPPPPRGGEGSMARDGAEGEDGAGPNPRSPFPRREGGTMAEGSAGFEHDPSPKSPLPLGEGQGEGGPRARATLGATNSGQLLDYVPSPVATGEGQGEGDPYRDTNGPGPGRGR